MTEQAAYSGPERRRIATKRVPALFVAHGSPNTVFDDEFGNALRRFAALQGRLDGAVVVSAHWESLRPVRVTRSVQPELLYDFSGMPSRIERMSYPCRGSSVIADQVLALLDKARIAAVADAGRGIDHGVWVPMSLAYPSARLPLVQVSLPLPADLEEIVAMGRALAPLRERNVLLVGSGGIVHNLHRLRFAGETHVGDAWALGFDEWAREQVGRLDVRALLDYRRRAPHALESVPTPEHFEPLLFVLGAAETGDRVYDVYEGFRYGSLSLRSFVLAGRRRDDLLGLRDRVTRK
jgi:4,5-DOPA dioxygenase extradiol